MTGFAVALLDVTIPAFIGKVVTLVTTSRADTLFSQSWHLLLGMALVLLVARPLALTAQNIVANQAIAANVTNMVRWQSHWHVVRQSWAFFQNDFAGHRQQGDADRSRDPSEPGLDDHGGLVHSRIRHERDAAARLRPSPGWRCRS